MKAFHSIQVVGLLASICVAVFSGCKGSKFPLAPVSGTVTVDGEPVVGVTVSFAPRAPEGSIIAGPYSRGETDSNGKYALTTRDGFQGAVAATHIVSIYYADVSDEDLIDDRSTKEDDRYVAEARAKMAGRIRIPGGWGEYSKHEITVTRADSNPVNFDLESKKKK